MAVPVECGIEKELKYIQLSKQLHILGTMYNNVNHEKFHGLASESVASPVPASVDEISSLSDMGQVGDASGVIVLEMILISYLRQGRRGMGKTGLAGSEGTGNRFREYSIWERIIRYWRGRLGVDASGRRGGLKGLGKY